MDITPIVMVALLPIGVASIAVPLALSCKRHPLTQAVIIPDDKPTGEPATTEQPQSSDLKTRRHVVVTVGFALGLVLFMSLMLWVLANAEYFADILSPLISVFEGMDWNTTLVMFLGFLLVLQLPGIAMSFVWITPWRGVLIGVICVSVLVTWALIDSWITINLLAAMWCILTALAFQPRISFLRLSVIMLIAAILYDAWQVYGTGNMQKLAEGMVPQVGAPQRELAYPGLFMIPGDLSISPHSYGLLGVGDVVVLCLLAISAARLGKKIGSRVPLLATLAGFAVAMVICSLMVRYFDAAQPATIYIVPLCSVPVVLYAMWRGRTDQLSMPFYARAPKHDHKKRTASD